jgi:hypothetical protein
MVGTGKLLPASTVQSFLFPGSAGRNNTVDVYTLVPDVWVAGERKYDKK